KDCQTSRALSSFISHQQMASGLFISPANPGYSEAAALLGNIWDKGIFSWVCINYELDNRNSYPTFSQTLPSPIRVLLTVMEYFLRAHAGVTSSDEDIWVHTANQVANSLWSHRLPVGVVLTTGQDSQNVQKALHQICLAEVVSLIIMCMHSALIGGEIQMHLLEWAHDMKMMDGTYVFVPYDALFYSLHYKHTSYQVLKSNLKLREAYDDVLTITVESQEKTFYQAKAAAKDEISEKLECELWISYGVHAAGIYECGLCGFPALGALTLGSRGFSLIMPFFLFLLLFANFNPLFAMMVYLALLIALQSINGFVYFISHHINKIQLIKGPNRILLTLEDVTFIKSHFGNKRGSHASVSFQITAEVQTRRSLRLSFSSGSLTPATYGNSNITIYKGDWVWLKKFPSGDFGHCNSIKSSASDVFEMMKYLHHKNSNPFLGFFCDSGIVDIVTEFCSEGILTNEDVKLDWMFKSSFLLYLIKGMKYLHDREFAHGRLKSWNCVVDGCFVLKVTDYGFNDILEMLRLSQEEHSAEELWTATELLRAPRGSRSGSFAGDVYSFAIIMQEVTVWGTPFCMMDLPAEETIDRLKKPLLVYRPVVPPKHTPLECLQLMKQCWAKAAEQRPTFDEIFNQVETTGDV
ncbi:LOW QUALITY PROTEIN: retinal guanylyl cyclase 2, partial [Glossophaga mutica]